MVLINENLSDYDSTGQLLKVLLAREHARAGSMASQARRATPEKNPYHDMLTKVSRGGIGSGNFSVAKHPVGI